MEPADNMPHRWDESDFVEEIVSDLASLEGVCGVEWIQQSPHYECQDLVRIETWQGDVFGLGISWVQDEEIDETFDDAFTQYLLGRSFEEVGCSCSMQRQRLKELEIQLDSEVLRFRSSLVQSPTGEAIAHLKRSIAEIDRIEHPGLDAMAREAARYLAQWIEENTEDGMEDKGLGRRDLILQYAQAWCVGWRPGTGS